MSSANLLDKDLPTTSPEFCADFGDFALRSRDNVLFYFPRAILQYSSEVFANMFELGRSFTQDNPILVQADARILSLLLKFAHPGLPNPPVADVTTIATLLQTSKQYGMDGVISNIRPCLIMPAPRGNAESMIKAEPLASLVVAHTFGYTDLVRLALREVVKCHMEKAFRNAGNYDIPATLMAVMHKLRQERIEWCREKLIYISMIDYGHWGHQSLTWIDSRRAQWRKWLQTAIRAVSEEPSFKVLKEQCRLILDMSIPRFDLSFVNARLGEWWEEADRIESALPDLE